MITSVCESEGLRLRLGHRHTCCSWLTNTRARRSFRTQVWVLPPATVSTRHCTLAGVTQVDNSNVAVTGSLATLTSLRSLALIPRVKGQHRRPAAAPCPCFIRRFSSLRSMMARFHVSLPASQLQDLPSPQHNQSDSFSSRHPESSIRGEGRHCWSVGDIRISPPHHHSLLRLGLVPELVSFFAETGEFALVPSHPQIGARSAIKSGAGTK